MELRAVSRRVLSCLRGASPFAARVRSPLAAWLVLILTAGWVWQLGGQASPAQNKEQDGTQVVPAPKVIRGLPQAGDYKNYDPATVERGKTLFAASCSFCHGANAKGGEGGPDLIRSLVVLDDENGERIGSVVLNGRPGTAMPKFEFSSAQVAELSAFLHDQVRQAATRGTYEILNILVGDPKAGQTYFNGAGACNHCHSVTGDLAHIGSRFSPVDLQQKFVMPREGEDSGYNTEGKYAPITAKVTLPSGQAYEGRLLHIDDFMVEIVDAQGAYHSFDREGSSPRVEVHDPLQSHNELLSRYTDADIHNLTAYLVTLK